ncbi:MAG: hypothetical protein JST12_13125 [Armatimonadetes bacterium]|nr:hypothetical protein [Armatimonadota bacterium]
METNPKQIFGSGVSRLGELMLHTNLYSFKGHSRLAQAVGSDKATISRLVAGHLKNPSFLLIARITAALEHELGRRIDPRDILSEHGAFLTRHVCDVVGCPGCLPPNAHDEFGDLKPTFRDVTPGQWVTAKHPKGFSLCA